MAEVSEPQVPELISVTAVRLLGGYLLEMDFDNGETRRLDVEPLLWGPAFAPLRENYDLFRQVYVDGGTVAWPGDLDQAPEELYARSWRVEPTPGPDILELLGELVGSIPRDVPLPTMPAIASQAGMLQHLAEMAPTSRAALRQYLVDRGVREDRVDRWLDHPTGLLDGGVPAELIADPSTRHRARVAARRFAEHQDPGFRWE